LIDPRQADPHARCKAVLPQLPAPLVTTWPSFTEAMYLAGRAGGWPLQRLLWRYIEDKVLLLHEPRAGEVERMAALMEQYRDNPMDLADASLVAAAEALGLARIFSLDHHFRIYRLKDARAFDVVP
jgi:predicted nucleic acid-binding protein